MPSLSVGSAFRLSFGSPRVWAEKNRGEQPRGLTCPAREPWAPFCSPFVPQRCGDREPDRALAMKWIQDGDFWEILVAL